MVIEVIAQVTFFGILFAAVGLISSWVLAFAIGGILALFFG
jgi:hypothetical protein